jgi:hypothetical protein
VHRVPPGIEIGDRVCPKFLADPKGFPKPLGSYT